MPKTTMNKDCLSIFPNNNVRRPRKISLMEAEAIAQSVDRTSY